MVGTLGSKLIVSTYDADFVSSNVPFSQRQKAVSKDFSMFSSASEETDDKDDALWRTFRKLRNERDAKEEDVKEEEQRVEDQEATEKNIGEGKQTEETKGIDKESDVAISSASLPDSATTPITNTWRESPIKTDYRDPIQTSGSPSIFRGVLYLIFDLYLYLFLMMVTIFLFLLAVMVFVILVLLGWKLVGMLILFVFTTMSFFASLLAESIDKTTGDLHLASVETAWSIDLASFLNARDPHRRFHISSTVIAKLNK